MSGKTLLIIGALTFSSLGIASAKSYDVILSASAMAGTTELKPGEYKIKVEGNVAVFTDIKDTKSFSIPVKVENSDRKFGNTALDSENQGGMDTVRAIELGGTNTRLTVGQ